MANKIAKIILDDGTELDATALKFIGLSSKGNVEITSDKNINIEPVKTVKFKPGAGAQIEFLADHTGDLTEVLLKFLKGVTEDGTELSKEIPIRAKFNCQEMEYNTKGASDINAFDVKFKTGVKDSATGEHYCQTKFKGRSFDIRCYEHGGIALQPCGKDSDNHENKIKFESSRTNDVNSEGTYSAEGGKGLEFGTFNNLHTSLFTKDYRFRADAPVFGATRTIEQDGDKVDYQTQGDDFKDILDPNQPNVTWKDLINAAAYLKAQGSIPSNGSWYGH